MRAPSADRLPEPFFGGCFPGADFRASSICIRSCAAQTSIFGPTNGRELARWRFRGSGTDQKTGGLRRLRPLYARTKLPHTECAVYKKSPEVIPQGRFVFNPIRNYPISRAIGLPSRNSCTGRPVGVF